MNVQKRFVHLNFIGLGSKVRDCWCPTEPSPYTMPSDNNRCQNRVHSPRFKETHVLSLRLVPQRPCVELLESEVLMRLPSRSCLCEICQAIKIAATLSRELQRMW